MPNGKGSEKMIYKNIEGIAQPVSRIVFGTATPAMMEGKDATELLDAVRNHPKSLCISAQTANTASFIKKAKTLLCR